MHNTSHLHMRTLGFLGISAVIATLFVWNVFAGNKWSFGSEFGNEFANTIEKNPLHVFMLQGNGGNVYAGWQYVFSPSDAPKDVLTVAQQINYTHNIGGDGLLAGAQIMFGPAATVYGDLRAAAGQFASAAKIKGDLLVAAGNITLDASSAVDGLTLLAGWEVSVQGKLAGNVRIFAENVVFDAQAWGDVMIEAKTISLGSAASIKWNLSYHAKAVNGSVDDITAGTVTGGIIAMTKDSKRDNGNRAGRWKWGFFGGTSRIQTICMLSVIVLSLILFLPLRKFWEHHQAETILKTPGTSFLIGFLLYIFMPIAAIILMITLIGFPIGLTLLLTYPLLFVLAATVNTCSFLGILHKWLPQSWRKAHVGLLGATIALALIFTHYRWLSILVSMRTYGGLTQLKVTALRYLNK